MIDDDEVGMLTGAQLAEIPMVHALRVLDVMGLNEDGASDAPGVIIEVHTAPINSQYNPAQPEETGWALDTQHILIGDEDLAGLLAWLMDRFTIRDVSDDEYATLRALAVADFEKLLDLPVAEALQQFAVVMAMTLHLGHDHDITPLHAREGFTRGAALLSALLSVVDPEYPG